MCIYIIFVHKPLVNVHINMYSLYACIHVWIYLYTYIYVCVYIHTFTHEKSRGNSVLVINGPRSPFSGSHFISTFIHFWNTFAFGDTIFWIWRPSPICSHLTSPPSAPWHRNIRKISLRSVVNVLGMLGVIFCSLNVVCAQCDVLFYAVVYCSGVLQRCIAVVCSSGVSQCCVAVVCCSSVSQ